MNPYIKTNWATNDLISAENLNKIENGIEAVTLSAADIAEDLETQVGEINTILDAIDELENEIGSVETSVNNIINGTTDIALNVNITYANLVSLRNSGTLKKGAFYRIIDYETTTVQESTRSAEHYFDIIVQALDEKTLSENAFACLHEGDTYFANSKLEAWKLKYCLDNDTDRFVWADEVNGKGVIYRMIDEFNNDVPYDFKNIQFKRKLTDGALDLDSGVDTWCYTFTVSDLVNTKLVDISLKQNTEYADDEGQYRECANNSIKEAILDYLPDGLIRTRLNDIVFLNVFEASGNNVYFGCFSNTFSVNCYSNTIGNSYRNNTFGNDCYSNTIGNDFCNNAIGNGFYDNTIGDNFNSNIIGNSFSSNDIKNNFDSNAIGNYFYNNTIGDGFSNNAIGNRFYDNNIKINFSNSTIGNEFYSNTVDNGFSYNTIGNYFHNNTIRIAFCYNTIGNRFYNNTALNECRKNTIGNYFYDNYIGNSCHSNTIGNECYSNIIESYFQCSTVGNNVKYVRFSSGGTSSNQVRYLYLKDGLAGASSSNRLDLYFEGLRGRTYPTTFEIIANGNVISSWEATPLTRTGKIKATKTTATWSDI